MCPTRWGLCLLISLFQCLQEEAVNQVIQIDQSQADRSKRKFDPVPLHPNQENSWKVSDLIDLRLIKCSVQPENILTTSNTDESDMIEINIAPSCFLSLSFTSHCIVSSAIIYLTSYVCFLVDNNWTSSLF